MDPIEIILLLLGAGLSTASLEVMRKEKKKHGDGLTATKNHQLSRYRPIWILITWTAVPAAITTHTLRLIEKIQLYIGKQTITTLKYLMLTTIGLTYITAKHIGRALWDYLA